MIYLLLTITSFGALFDNRFDIFFWFLVSKYQFVCLFLIDRSYLIILEIFRCIIYFVFDYFIIQSTKWPIHRNTSILIQILLWTIRFGHLLSIIFWICMWIKNIFTNNNNNIDDKRKGLSTTDSNEKIIYDSNEGQSQTSQDSDETMMNQNHSIPVKFRAQEFITTTIMMISVFIPLLISYLFVIPSCSLYYEQYFFDNYLTFTKNLTIITSNNSIFSQFGSN